VIIHLGRSSPSASSSLPWNSGEQPSIVPLRGLAPNGVCHATDVTAGAVGSYPTVSPLPGARERPGRFVFCCTVLEVSLTGRYPAFCSVEPGLSSRPLGPSDHLFCVDAGARTTGEALRREASLSWYGYRWSAIRHSAAIRRSGAWQARGRAGSTQRRCRGCPPGGRLAADRCGRALRRPPRRAAGPP